MWLKVEIYSEVIIVVLISTGDDILVVEFPWLTHFSFEGWYVIEHSYSHTFPLLPAVVLGHIASESKGGWR